MSKKKDRTLNLFIRDPNREFNVREASRLARISPSTASTHLNALLKEGFLKRKRERGFVLYSADTGSRTFKDYKIYANITAVRSSGLVAFLEKELNFPEVIILFGSWAKGENTKESDIDLFILSESKAALNVDRFEKKLGAEIQMFIFSRKKAEQMKTVNKELLNNILNGLRLSGFLEVFR